MMAPVNGTDERLDAILAELRAIREYIEQRDKPAEPFRSGLAAGEALRGAISGEKRKR